MLKEQSPRSYADVIKKEQDELVISYMPALRAMAFRLKERLPSSIDVNDLISVGIEEMIKLSRRYDKDQNDNFWGFARKRVNGSMLDYLRRLDVMSRNNRKILKDIDVILDEYFLENECEPDDEYLAKKLEIDVERVREVRAAHAISYTLPFDEQIEMYSEDETLEKIERGEFLEHINEILDTLKERDQLIIQLYYYEELSLKEISEILNVSESRISQIHKKLLKKLRERLS
ncbi:RNA polymerase sigma factor FliA [Campylobacter upsaliensis]|uniref:Flagellar biosynthesis sigma factor n=1 Tax=Campylobacter upsaliensis TaxID=28080 RepID=A0A381EIH8_CAMUP|nr:RNA polymerase sigma factor FliA [Campylobacter upsaliensis]EAL53916.1 alternative transcription initiation factor, sigma-F (fliA) [Campylobacter upsaliensis RM3195]MCR2101440.1 RNA polymerase sigma factor FliA [Campylobacter upsaliensis]MCR2110572.1 RNA polymerase sigma factor FliA [Campylobacter upsaliensis]MCR2114289.1 RNA polymerase sigma factor FliA [Campylobacter upsaliensis]MCR2116159.1 RNA polymerase sigma factor FliA [Campylobacter upsaliensis]